MFKQEVKLMVGAHDYLVNIPTVLFSVLNQWPTLKSHQISDGNPDFCVLLKNQMWQLGVCLPT